jgi:hypothetical protein
LWKTFLETIKAYDIGDLASVAGVIISLVGFVATIVGVVRSRQAAEQARAAAESARDRIRLFDTVQDFASAISTLEDLKRAHRSKQWEGLPDRYAGIRKLLINLRTSSPNLTEKQKTAIQRTLQNLRVLEQSAEEGLVDGAIADTVRFNAKLSDDIDELVAILGELKMANTGAAS